MHNETTIDIKELYALNQRINDRIGGKYRDYIGDLNAAMTLIVASGLQNRFSLGGDRDMWEASIESATYDEYMTFDAIETADTPALAIVRAWLVYTAMQPAASGPGSADAGDGIDSKGDV